MSWMAILVLSAGCYLAKLLGVLAGHRFATRLEPVTLLLPAALFAGIVVLMTLADGTNLVVDARLAGVVVAAVAVSCRAPFVLVVGLAMLVTGGIRLLT
ncbi:MAG: hypothetical protein P8M16_06415 [Acidimicrobiales bacterium]|nr:hypothetical protein [Acidimicrobiales bacterium]